MIDTVGLVHTRGVPLVNLAILCTVLRERGGGTEKRHLLLSGKKLGLKGFAQVEINRPLPTRVRHHEYALTALELVASSDAHFVLTPKGQHLAEVTVANGLRTNKFDPNTQDSDLPDQVLVELRTLLCASRYIRYWWLRFLMPRGDFSYQELLSEGHDFVIERVSLARRETKRAIMNTEPRDTGLRIHSYFNEHESTSLTSVQRREIYAGIRKWTIDVGLVGQVGGWDRIFDIEEEYSRKLDSPHNRLERVYIVKKHWNNEIPIERFEQLLLKVREASGYMTRVPIPELVIQLALEEKFSIKNIHALLQRLHRERHAKYFFESASKSVITQPANPFPLSTYVQIDGTWRTDIVFTGSAN